MTKIKQMYLAATVVLIVCFAHTCGIAQLLTLNNVAVTVTGATLVTNQGDILLNNGGIFNNNGTIDLTGHFTNNSLTNGFAATFPSGTVICNGAAQNIGGNSYTIFNNLTLTGTGNKTLLQDIGVGGNTTTNGVLALNDRQLLLNSFDLTVRNPLPVAITRTTGFIVSETPPATGYGVLTWNISNGTVGNNYTFPFGNNTTSNYLPLNFNVTTSGVGATGSVSIATYPTNTALNPNNRPLPTGLTALINNSGADNSAFVVDRYFMFNVANYTTLPVTTMVFPYRDLEWNTGTNTIIENNLRMQRLNNGTQWTQPPFGIVNTALNTVTVTGQNNYSPIWTIVDLTTPLPITLLDFTAKLNQNNYTILNWITANELNSAYFDIEKSTDGQHFSFLHKVMAAQFSNSTLQYHDIDSNPAKGFTYYRIKMVDNNGDFKYSNTQFVYTNLQNATVSVWPNPATNFINITISDAETPYQSFAFVNGIGQTVFQADLKTYQDTKNNYTIPCNNLPSGLYYLQLSNGVGKPFACKIFIQ